MGRRSATETLGAIYQAFLRQRTWAQAELAADVGIAVPALRRHLDELCRRGMPLERQEDHPHVYWSVPRDWFPGGVAFEADESAKLLGQLARLPRSVQRDAWIDRILRSSHAGAVDPTASMLPPPSSDTEEAYLPLAQEAAAKRVTLHFRYFSAARGAVDWRHASVQRVAVGPPARFVAVCHRDGALKWFRIDNLLAARLEPTDAYRARDAADVDAFLRASIDGFHQGERPVSVAFFVREPESRWVARNLPGPLRVDVVPGGVWVSAETSALVRLARFVVGLGAAARCESPELARIVRELAEGALLSSGARSDLEGAQLDLWAPPSRSDGSP